MSRHKNKILLLSLWMLLASAATMPADEPASKAGDKPDASFVRLVRDDDDEPITLQTSIVRFTPAEGQDGHVVDLVGAVHIGEKSYYDTLNNAFDDYDVVLYELVAPEGAIPDKKAGGGGHPIGALQQGMKRMLQLEFQLDRIDYAKKNFVHADMTPEQFAESMKDRGENFWTMFMKMMNHAMEQQAAGAKGPSDVEILAALFAKDRALRLKRMMAEQFEDMDGMLSVFEGPDGSTMITERNKVALKVLKKQIEGGKQRIAIFYGAGHLPDMEKRLTDDFKLVKGDVRWLDAWDLKEK